MRSIAIALALAAASTAAEMPPAASIKINFEQHVEPILSTKCYGCHGPVKQLGGLRLDRRQAALRGGDYGKVMIPGVSEKSKLIHRLIGNEAGMQMPPAGPLEPHEVSILRAWIDQGPDYGNSQLTAERKRKPASAAFVALVDAIANDDVNAVRKAIAANRGLAKEVDEGGSTALIHAAGRGSMASMRALLDAQPALDAANGRGATALTWSLSDPEKVKLLLERGAAVNGKTIEGRTPLHVAAQQPSLEEPLKLLLAAGADPNAADIAGITPLHLAATVGSARLAALLIDAGAKVNVISANGSTPLIMAAVSGSSETVKLLLAKGADAKPVTKRSASALGGASYWGNVEVMKMLIAKGAPVQLHETDGYSPLMYAAYSEHGGVEAVKLLLAHGANPKSGGDGETAASLATKRGAKDVVQLLRDAETRLAAKN
ncbi:MAG: ankyrin repeat domain-containing protein [Bryobacterales bacterium]|nr:ankyrin repeat domain-containing protein [Bryobacterales bacterium]